MVDTALVPEVLGQPEETARRLLDQAGLTTEVQTGCDTDAAGATAEPGRVWRRAGPGEPGRRRQPGRPVGQLPGVPSSHHNDHTGEADAHQHAEREETEVG